MKRLTKHLHRYHIKTRLFWALLALTLLLWAFWLPKGFERLDYWQKEYRSAAEQHAVMQDTAQRILALERQLSGMDALLSQPEGSSQALPKASLKSLLDQAGLTHFLKDFKESTPPLASAHLPLPAANKQVQLTLTGITFSAVLPFLRTLTESKQFSITELGFQTQRPSLPHAEDVLEVSFIIHERP